MGRLAPCLLLKIRPKLNMISEFGERSIPLAQEARVQALLAARAIWESARQRQKIAASGRFRRVWWLMGSYGVRAQMVPKIGKPLQLRRITLQLVKSEVIFFEHDKIGDERAFMHA